jgi:hypothetical protein
VDTGNLIIYKRNKIRRLILEDNRRTCPGLVHYQTDERAHHHTHNTEKTSRRYAMYIQRQHPRPQEQKPTERYIEREKKSETNEGESQEAGFLHHWSHPSSSGSGPCGVCEYLGISYALCEVGEAWTARSGQSAPLVQNPVLGSHTHHSTAEKIQKAACKRAVEQEN